MKIEKRNMIKRIGLGSILLLLLMPLIQEYTNLVKIRPLGGWAEPAQKPVFSLNNWFDGKFQTESEQYINENFGFRNFLVRVNNQLDYWLFRKANAKNIIYGKNDILFDRLYTDAYFGLNFMGKKRIDSIANQMKYLQDKLEKSGKMFVMVFAPGKATFYSEYIPDSYRTEKHKSNYEEFIKVADEKGINHIDFNKWFLEQKNKSKYPLYPQLGIHWNEYGAALAFDSIEKYIEEKKGIDMPDFKIIGVETPDTLRSTDDDIYRALNLLIQIPYYKMAYPVTRVMNDSSKHKPKVITIGDSYWWTIYYQGVGESVFNEAEFWYYNREIYKLGIQEPVKKETIDFNKKIEQAEIIVFCYTESTLQDIGSGFLDDLNRYYERNNPNRAKEIEDFVNYIKSDKGWMETIVKRAKEMNLPQDSVLLMDARWQVDFNSKK